MINKIKMIRLKMGIGKIEFGKLLGVQRQMVFRYERGDCNPSIKVAAKLVKLAEKINIRITISDLFEQKLTTYNACRKEKRKKNVTV